MRLSSSVACLSLPLSAVCLLRHHCPGPSFFPCSFTFFPFIPLALPDPFIPPVPIISPSPPFLLPTAGYFQVEWRRYYLGRFPNFLVCVSTTCNFLVFSPLRACRLHVQVLPWTPPNQTHHFAVVFPVVLVSGHFGGWCFVLRIRNLFRGQIKFSFPLLGPFPGCGCPG